MTFLNFIAVTPTTLTNSFIHSPQILTVNFQIFHYFLCRSDSTNKVSFILSSYFLGKSLFATSAILVQNRKINEKGDQC